MKTEATTLQGRFLETAAVFPDRPAIEVGGHVLSYAELRNQAFSLAATLNAFAPTDPPLTAIYAYRTVSAYVAILAALFRGHGYVPLSARVPASRTRDMLQRTGARALIVDSEGEKTLGEVLSENTEQLVILMLDRAEVNDLQNQWPIHRFLSLNDLLKPDSWKHCEVDPGTIAYILFTSGSAGEPKGVMVTHRNICTLIDALVDRYSFTHNDRLSQLVDITFDTSVGDIFCAWDVGASVCSPSYKTLLNPVRYLNEEKITVFQSVPSNVLLMNRLSPIKPDQFPWLRVSIFEGEPLPVELARLWTAAAPNSIVENLYGPTEATVYSTWYRWDNVNSQGESEIGIVPIGYLLPGFKALVVDEELKEVVPGSKGELLLAGPQLSLGYLGDPEKTKRAFIKPPSFDEIYYRTGDLVRRPVENGPIKYLGRLDHQIKIFGMRIELGEIEAVLREESGVLEAVAIGWPITDTGVGGIVAFLGSETVDVKFLQERLKNRLPQQMMPREIRLMKDLPLNSNGKVDRVKLRDILDGRG